MLKNLKEFKLAEVEAEVLKFWKQNSIFEQSLAKNKGNKKFVFFEGPPTANGMPGIHHQIGRSFKDIIPRFKAMQGFDVPRKAGWDTHGLPVEIQAEKELGFTGKQDIEKYGIAEFNKKCKELVWRYRTEFENATDRLGFWVDMKHPYITYENSYIESLWWVIGQMDKKKLLYEGHKIVPWCTRCGTALSSHELAQGYKEVEDTSVYVKFKLTGKSVKKLESHFAPTRASRDNSANTSVFVLSWTTTPWTLPGNVALAVGEKIEYSVIVDDKDMVVPQWILKIMGGIFFGIGFVLLLLLARGDDREAISRIGGLLGAWSFGVPATFAFPGLWYAWTHRPNALFRAEDLFGSEQYLIGGIFTVLGLVTLVASLALYRYQARTGLPGWSWSREWRPKE
jgi:isoleucyl-tRNA synthetase